MLVVLNRLVLKGMWEGVKVKRLLIKHSLTADGCRRTKTNVLYILNVSIV